MRTRPVPVLWSVLLVAFLSLAGLPASAQSPQPPEELLIPDLGAKSALSAAQKRALDNVHGRSTTAETALVRPAHLERLALGKAVRLTVAPGKTVVVLPEKVETRKPDDFTYFGRIRGAEGNAILVVQQGTLTGSVRIGLDLYQIEPLGRGLHALVRVDPRGYPLDGPEPAGAAAPLSKAAPEAAAPQGGGGKLQNLSAASTTPIITVMVAYTPSAANAHGNIQGLIQLAVDETNASFSASGVTPRIELVKTHQVSYSESFSNNHATDRDRFRGTSDGYMDEVHGLRSAYGADLMVLLINDNALCGLAYGIGVGASDAFVTVHYNCATGNYSFGHELAHLAGARHDNDNSFTPYLYGHGYSYSAGGWRTIMAVANTSLTRIQRWSNPNLTYNGVATGTSNFSNNARVWNERAATLAAFRSDAPCAGIPDNLKSWWSLDETSGATAANRAPTAPAGTHYNGPVPVTGRVSGGLSFDGVNDYVRAADSAALDVGTGDFSVAGWIKTTQAPNAHILLLDKRPADSGVYAGYSVHLYGGSLGLQMADAGWTGFNNLQSSAFVADGKWHHFAVTVDRDSATGVRFYLDGEPVGGTFNPTPFAGSLSNAADLYIGSRFNQTGFFQGSLDEVQLVGRALSAIEVRSMHAAGGKGTCQPQALTFNLMCDNLGPEWFCSANPFGGFGPYNHNWFYTGEGTMVPGGTYAEIFQPRFCSSQNNLIEVQVTDSQGGSVWSYQYLPCEF